MFDLSTDQIEDFNQTLGYSFKNTQLLEQALTHSSFNGTHNERLELLGDKVLDLTILTILFIKYPYKPEGILTDFLSSLVREEKLTELAQQLNLSNYLRLGASIIGLNPTERPTAILADALEAIIGAIYLDSNSLEIDSDLTAHPLNLSACQHFINHCYGDALNKIAYHKPLKDPKSTLQEYLQAQGKSLPQYQTLNQTGSSHAPIFEVICELSGNSQSSSLFFKAKGKTKQEAEQAAAAGLLEKLQTKL